MRRRKLLRCGRRRGRRRGPSLALLSPFSSGTMLSLLLLLLPSSPRGLRCCDCFSATTPLHRIAYKKKRKCRPSYASPPPTTVSLLTAIRFRRFHHQLHASPNKKDNDDIEDDENFENMSTAVVGVDLLALAVACQLLGLLDALNDPEFFVKGGWFQPIPAAPPSLPTLASRFAVNAVAWIVASLAATARASSEILPVSTSEDEPDSAVVGLRSLPSTFLAFFALRLLFGVAISYLDGNNAGGQAGGPLSLPMPPTIVESLRECYVIGLATTAGRFIASTINIL